MHEAGWQSCKHVLWSYSTRCEDVGVAVWFVKSECESLLKCIPCVFNRQGRQETPKLLHQPHKQIWLWGKAGCTRGRGGWMRWKPSVRTLLRVADHHELLADVSTAVHRDEKLAGILFHWEDLLREEHHRLWRSRAQRGVKHKRTSICSNPRGIYPLRYRILVQLSIKELLLTFLSILVFWSAGPAECFFIFKNNCPSVFQRCCSKRPFWMFFVVFFSCCLVSQNYKCKHLTSSQSDSAESFVTHNPL